MIIENCLLRGEKMLKLDKEICVSLQLEKSVVTFSRENTTCFHLCVQEFRDANDVLKHLT